MMQDVLIVNAHPWIAQDIVAEEHSVLACAALCFLEQDAIGVLLHHHSQASLHGKIMHQAMAQGMRASAYLETALEQAEQRSAFSHHSQ